MTPPLTSIEAAKFLRLHVVTVREYAKAQKIPAARLPDGDYRFLQDDLVAYLRGQYSAPETPTLAKSCPSTSKKALPSGGRASPSQASLAYVDRLAKRIESKRNASMTSGRPKHGR